IAAAPSNPRRTVGPCAAQIGGRIPDLAGRRQLQSEDIVPRRGPHEVDMSAHDFARTLSVALEYGRDDDSVLFVRLRQTIRDSELRAAERRNPLPDADRRRQQELVVRAAIDDIVELEIEGPVALRVVAAHGVE